MIFITWYEFMLVFSSHKHDWMIGWSIHGPLNNGLVCSKLVFISLLRTGTLNIQEAERNSGPVWLFAYSASVCVLLTAEFLMGNDGNGRSVTTIGSVFCIFTDIKTQSLGGKSALKIYWQPGLFRVTGPRQIEVWCQCWGGGIVTLYRTLLSVKPGINIWPLESHAVPPRPQLLM